MSSAIVLESSVDRDWWCKLEVIANTQEDLAPFRAMVPAIEPGKVTVSKEAGAWHLRAYAPLRSRLDLQIPLGFWPIMAWWIGDSKVSTAMIDGGAAFALVFGVDPAFAFIKQIPPKATEFVEVKGITLIQESWVPDGYLAFVRGGQLLIGGTNGR